MKHTDAVDTPAERATVLYSFRLRLLKLLLLCGSSAIALIWFLETWTARVVPLDQVAYPVMIAIFSASCVVLFIRPRLLEQIEELSFTTFAVYIILHTQPSMLADADTYTLSSLAQWFPLVYTTAFFFLRTRRAILVSGLIYMAVLVPYCIDLVIRGSGLWDSDRGLLMLNTFCAHPVYIVALSGISKLKTDIIQARAHADLLQVAASVDYLTGVANRRAAAQMLQRALDHAHDVGTAVSVILLDIDHFKTVNDTFGHDVGDTVLCQVPAILQQHVRASDMLGRWGGEEFVVVASATDAVEAAQIAERLRALMAKHEFQHVGQLTASFGVATSLGDDTPDTLVKRADKALYQAKQRGRNRVETLACLNA